MHFKINIVTISFVILLLVALQLLLFSVRLAIYGYAGNIDNLRTKLEKRLEYANKEDATFEYKVKLCEDIEVYNKILDKNKKIERKHLKCPL